MFVKKTAIVLGAGWAGLSTAVKLAESGISVTLLEASPKAGGRARSIFFGDDLVDNGQHLLIGAYQHVLKLLKIIDVSESTCFQRVQNRLMIHNLAQNQLALDLKLPNLFPPLHLVMALLLEKNLSMRERARALRFCRAVQALDFQLAEDISVLDLLKQHFQTPLLIETLWQPLALATLSTPIEIASAQIFLKVLHDAFSHKSENSDFLFPKLDLSEILPNPAVQYLNDHDSEILYHQRGISLLMENTECVGIETDKGIFKADHIILATPPNVTADILQQSISFPSDSLSLTLLMEKLKSFSYEPITTIYLRYPNPIHFAFPMIGIMNSCSQWIFDRSFANQPNVMSVVISSEIKDLNKFILDPDLDKNREDQHDFNHQLTGIVSAEVKKIFPRLQTPIQSKVITEKRAAFACTVNIEVKRPDNITPIPNLFLAGDYTNTGYPSTLEGAVMSGFAVSSLICLNKSTVSSNLAI